MFYRNGEIVFVYRNGKIRFFTVAAKLYFPAEEPQEVNWLNAKTNPTQPQTKRINPRGP